MAESEIKVEVEAKILPKEYDIVNAFSAWGLKKQVNKMLAQGWRLEGGICKTWGGFYQALSK